MQHTGIAWSPRSQGTLLLTHPKASASQDQQNQDAERIPPRIRLPITVHILEKIHTTLIDSSDPDKTAIWAIAATAFFGFFRLGELLPASQTAFHPARSLAWGDVAVDNHADPMMVQVHL